jgi:hypothetical protein
LYNSYKSFASCDALPAPISLFITPNLDKVPEKLERILLPDDPSCCKRRFPSVLFEVPGVTLEVIGVVVFSYMPLLILVGLDLILLTTLLVLLSVKAGTKATISPS